MNVIESTNIDLIEPFPINQARRAYDWLHCFHNVAESDLSPKSPEEFEQYLANHLALTRSFGVIDRNNQLNFRHEAPLVGMIVFEPSTLWNCYVHIASPRRAWGLGFMDEGLIAAIDHIFKTEPSILRISAFVMANNGPVKGMARRLGFRYEGRMEHMLTQKGVPKDLLHFGMTKSRWAERTVLPAEAETELPADEASKEAE